MAQKKITDLALRSNFDTTCNIPVDDSTQTYRVTGAQILTWMQSLQLKSNEITNISLSASVGSNALTITLKDAGGNNLSSTNPATVGVRSSTITSGTFAQRSITSNLSLVISSGSTLGHASGRSCPIYVYLIDNAGTLELAAGTVPLDEDGLLSTTAEGGAGAADSNRVIYSTTARSNVGYRLIGMMLSTQTTAGTWAAVPTKIALMPFKPLHMGVRASASGTQTGLNNTDATVQWNTIVDVDPYVLLDTSTYTVTAIKTGWWRYKAQIHFEAIASGEYARVRILKNAGLYKEHYIRTVGPDFTLNSDVEMYLAPGDTVIAHGGSGDANFNLNNTAQVWDEMSFHYLGP